MKSTRRWQQLLLNSLAIILGNALYSLAVALFLEPAGLITGGATGIALAFGRLTGLSVSGFLFLFNMSMLVWGWAVLGKKFALNTLASSVLSPAFLGLFERLLDGYADNKRYTLSTKSQHSKREVEDNTPSDC